MMKLLILRNQRLRICHLRLCRNPKTCGDLLTNQTIDFPSHQNLQSPKILKFAITFDLSRHAKSSSTATTGFISSTKMAIGGFSLLTSISADNYPFYSLRLTSDSPKKSSIFQYGIFSIFKAQFP